MILSYENKNNTYYLDATGRYIQLEYPSSFIQGKEALIANGNNFKVKKIPIVPAHLNKVVDTTYIQISNRDIIGTSNSTFSGYIKNNLFYNLENTRKEADVKELYNKRFLKGSNKFLIKSYKEENKFSYDKDFSVSYNFSIQDYVQNIGSEIFINPHFNKIVSFVKTKEDRKYDIEFDYKRQFSYTNIIEIPDGYEVSYIPTSVSFTNNLISINLSYSTDKNKMYVEQEQSCALDGKFCKLEDMDFAHDIARAEGMGYGAQTTDEGGKLVWRRWNNMMGQMTIDEFKNTDTFKNKKEIESAERLKSYGL